MRTSSCSSTPTCRVRNRSIPTETSKSVRGFTRTGGVLSNDTDPDGDALEAVLLGGPTNGTLALAADGSFSYQQDGSETLSDSFVYEARGKLVGKVLGIPSSCE